MANPVLAAMQKKWGKRRAIRMYFARIPAPGKPGSDQSTRSKESRVGPGNRNP